MPATVVVNPLFGLGALPRMTRLARSVTAALVAGSALALPTAAGAASGSDTSSHSYTFDHTLADSDGGPGAVAHGSVPFAPGRNDPPLSTDGSVHFDGRPSDYLSLPAPTLDYQADFTLDLWISTHGSIEQTVVDTRGRCNGAGGGWAIVVSDGRVAVEGAGEDRTVGGDDDRTVGGLPADDDRARGPRVNDGHWHEITLTLTGDAFVLDVDGRPAGGATRTAPDVTGATAHLAEAGGATARVATTHEGGGVTTVGPEPDPASWRDARLGGGQCGDADPFRGDLDDLTTSLAPPPALPEVPVAALLPLSAGLAGGAVLLRRSRRRPRPAHRRTR